MAFIFISLYILFLVLNYYDAQTTIFVCKHFGFKSEKNPFARFMIKKIGLIKGVVSVKSIIIFISPLIIWSFLESPVSIILTLSALNLLYFYVVINNYKICKKINPKYSLFKKSL